MILNGKVCLLNISGARASIAFRAAFCGREEKISNSNLPRENEVYMRFNPGDGERGRRDRDSDRGGTCRHGVAEADISDGIHWTWTR